MRFSYILAALPLTLAAPVLDVPRDMQRVPGRFIVVMKEDASDGVFADALSRLTSILGKAPERKHSIGKFKAFTITASNPLVQLIQNIASIDFIEPDTVVTTQALVKQNNAPYGLARISSRTKGSTTYTYDSSAGQGTFFYGIDTGINCNHEDFGGRCIQGASFVDEAVGDLNGHGTHTAATAAGTTYGVAKKATVIAVKVLSGAGSGSNSGVISGIEWAANDVVRRGAANKAVANLSLGGLRIGSASNRAVAAAVAKGLFMAVAAGNSNAPAQLYSPASEPTACTVGASDANDKFASFSNYGRSVDITAPGVNVKSAWIGNNTATNTISGTSMAAPHIAGLGAYLLALEGPRNPVALCDRIADLSTKNAISGAPGFLNPTPNRLAFNGVTA